FRAASGPARIRLSRETLMLVPRGRAPGWRMVPQRTDRSLDCVKTSDGELAMLGIGQDGEVENLLQVGRVAEARLLVAAGPHRPGEALVIGRDGLDLDFPPHPRLGVGIEADAQLRAVMPVL